MEQPHSPKTLRWGVLGTSFISHTVASAITASPSSTITSVFGRDVSSLTSFAEKFCIPKHYQSIDSLLDDDEVDVVYVGLPSHLHAEAVIKAAKRGRAILSEKALTTTMEDARALIDAVREADVFFVEGLMYLSHPLMAKVAEIIKSGDLGEVRGMTGYYAANIWKKANPLGMGTLYNLGCYPISLVHWVMQTAFGEEAFTSRTLHGVGNLAPDGSHVRDASLTVRFANGVLAAVQSSDSFGNDFSFSIQGDKASLRFVTNPWLPSEGESVLEIKTYKGGKVERVSVPNERTLDAFGWQVRMVEEGVRRGRREAERPSPRWRDSLEIMEILTQWEGSIMNTSK